MSRGKSERRSSWSGQGGREEGWRERGREGRREGEREGRREGERLRDEKEGNVHNYTYNVLTHPK